MKRLESLKPFFGITYLVCKKHRLPVGHTASVPINNLEEDFLNAHFKVDPRSEFYFQPFRSPNRWLNRRYPSTGSQKVRTQGDFAAPFLHPRNTDQWGWRKDYVDILEKLLTQRKGKRAPAFALAVWLMRDEDWPSRTAPESIIAAFYKAYSIKEEERKRLFDSTVPKDSGGLFDASPLDWSELRRVVGSAPDAAPDEGGVLSHIELRGIGPAERLVLRPASRLTIIAGDNGLGKTLLLDSSWWALTGEWAGMQAYPLEGGKQPTPSIAFAISASQAAPEVSEIRYDWEAGTWPMPKRRPTLPGLTVYARVDGSFAIWDPRRRAIQGRRDERRSLVFTREELWFGQHGTIEGILRDWVKWQASPKKYPFDQFCAVLKRISPSDLGPLTPGDPVRVPGYAQEVPTLQYPYGSVPILFGSAGVRRMVTLAYLIVWAWNEHRVAADQQRQPLQRQLVVLVDEMEAHLHPQWQRVVLPSLLDVGAELSKELEAQFIVSTHSPLVLASIEPLFSEETDALYHLGLSEKGRVLLDQIPFFPRGHVDAWLTSDVFNLRQARSTEAEDAIEQAKGLQKKKPVARKEVARVHELLTQYLTPEDDFWPRWVLFAEKYGVDL